MKHDPIHLLYHSMHARPMRGCLPLFVLLSALLVGGVIALFEVSLPEPAPPRGEGLMLYQRDDLTRFRVRQQSALPLRLHTLPLRPMPELLPPPSRLQPVDARDSFVLDDAYLLEFPPPNLPEKRKEAAR